MRRMSKATPTSIIEKAPVRGETFWAGRKGKGISRLKSRRLGTGVYSVSVPRAATRLVHTHNGYRGSVFDLLPSTSDLHGLVIALMSENQLRNYHIAVKKGKTAVGYTFGKIDGKQLVRRLERIAQSPELKMRYPIPQAYFDSVVRQYQQSFAKFEGVRGLNERLSRTIPKWLYAKLGLKLRFVPNRKEGYDYKGGIFVKQPRNQ